MTRTTSKASASINGLDPGQDSGSVYLKRARRRRLDLKTLHGTLRESARVYRELAEKRITLAEAEVRSRVLKRHGEILAAVEERQQRQELIEQLQRVGAAPGQQALEHVGLLPAAEAGAEVQS